MKVQSFYLKMMLCKSKGYSMIPDVGIGTLSSPAGLAGRGGFGKSVQVSQIAEEEKQQSSKRSREKSVKHNSGYSARPLGERRHET